MRVTISPRRFGSRILLNLTIIAALASPTLAQAAQEKELWREIKVSGVGCTNVEKLIKLVEYMAAKDTEATKKAGLKAFRDGECTAFELGESVFVVETASILVKLRRRGQIEEYWTHKMAIAGEEEPAQTKSAEPAGPKSADRPHRGTGTPQSLCAPPYRMTERHGCQK